VELTSNPKSRRNFSGVLSTRQGTLAVAGACALVAIGVLVLAISKYRESVNSSTKEATVLVASRLIQKGTAGDAVASGQLFAPAQVLQKQVSIGAVADASALRGKVAATNFFPGQQLTASDFVVATGLGTELSANQRAISVPVDQSHGLVGVVQSGDHVDVYAGFQGQSTAGAVVRLLASNVLVLQAPASAGGGIGGSQNGQVVLAATPKLAAQLAFTADNGKVWIVLRPGNGTTSAEGAATMSSILSGGVTNGAGSSRP
jgi:Flp pilus assembly protein CpaB